MVSILVLLAIFVAGMEFATDYGEALEGTVLAALPEGHQHDDGHSPADHGLNCDNCHFGGIHLIAFTASAATGASAATQGHTPWVDPMPMRVARTPPNPPPIA